MPEIRESEEAERGCGFRKPGGLYLVAEGLAQECGRLPLELARCPACGQGVKPARGWSWVEPGHLFAGTRCRLKEECPAKCPLSEPAGMGRAGLLWIGGKFYETPGDFCREAAEMGVSRRISAVPVGFEVGKTWVFVGHREAIWRKCPDCTSSENLVLAAEGEPVCETCEARGEVPVPAIFHSFRPQRIEYVVKGTETDDELERLTKRGIDLVRVVQVKK